MSFDPYIPDDPPEAAAPAVSSACWMSMLHNGKLLSQVTMPGVCLNSCTETELPELLRTGVRFLETNWMTDSGVLVRLKNADIPLKRLVGSFRAFLRENPSECLVLRASDHPEEFGSALRRILPEDMLMSDGIPGMEQVRGKVFLSVESMRVRNSDEALSSFLKQAEHNPDALLVCPVAPEEEAELQTMLCEGRFGYRSLGVPLLCTPSPDQVREIIEVNFYARLEMKA